MFSLFAEDREPLPWSLCQPMQLECCPQSGSVVPVLAFGLVDLFVYLHILPVCRSLEAKTLFVSFSTSFDSLSGYTLLLSVEITEPTQKSLCQSLISFKCTRILKNVPSCPFKAPFQSLNAVLISHLDLLFHRLSPLPSSPDLNPTEHFWKER